MEKLIIHGGISELGNRDFSYKLKNDNLRHIIEESFQRLKNDCSKNSVLHAIKMLEDNPMFNAGTGSKIQIDKEIRMSAALMDGKKNIFSGIINVQNIKNPIEAAEMLSSEEFSVLSGDQANDFCMKKGMAKYNPLTPERLNEFEKKIHTRHGTVGAVAIDKKGDIFVGTSTGGVGFELPGRVSDSPTVAGTYASKKAGVSCTGIGEQITQQAVAAKIVTRVDDGMDLNEAVEKTMIEANEFGYLFGIISLDFKGNFEVGKTEGIDEVFYASHDGKGIRTFFQK